MARVSLVEKNQADPIMKEVYQRLEDQNVPILNLFKVLGHCPRIGRNWVRLGNAILRRDDLSPRLRQLAILRVGHLTRSEYEFTKHVPVGLREGVTRQQIDAISDWATSAAFNDEERAVMRYTDEVTQNVKVKDDTFAKLRNFLNEPAIVKLTATIGYYGMVSRILVALQVELEPSEEAYLPKLGGD